MAASIKNLAGHTVYYGLSNIAAKFLNQLLTPLLTYLLSDAQGQQHFGEMTLLYAAISMANIVFTYGMETAYFRFSADPAVARGRLFESSFGSLLLTTLLFGAALLAVRQPIADFFAIGSHPEYISFSVLIIMLDTLAALPFAKLRQESRPKRYAVTKVANVLVNIFFVLLLIVWGRKFTAAHPGSAITAWYRQYTDTGFLMLANLAGSAATFLLLFREWGAFRFRIDFGLLRAVLAYALPFVIIGLGGMVNETFDRILLQKLLPVGVAEAKRLVGIYSANYRIAIFISLFIQAFRMAAEPFFFAQAADKNAPRTYAKVMKWFVITLCFAFLFTALFLDVWKFFINKNYWGGLGVVPILLYANIALGIYYNLSVWYKNSGRLRFGTGITLLGAALTLLINFTLIPVFGMYASAGATFVCYVSMMLLSYHYGQKYYPIPYPVKKLAAYIVIISLLFGLHQLFSHFIGNVPARLAFGVLLLLLFVRLLMRTERKELSGFPVVGKFVRK